MPEPAPDFAKPLELLEACHAKIRQHCQLLVDLCTYLETHSPDEDAHATCKKLYRYFSVSVPHHHKDEEQGLFPLLLASPQLSQDITALISKLKLEHFELDKLWLKFEPVVKNTDLVTLAIMTNQARMLQQSYDQHIEQENALLLPAAEQLLKTEQLHRLGQQMKTRRQ
ncbi:MAG: hemerythrin domain-containing protein [Gammaproteobacteria bacterium]|nr:hemerythrin domain-containing protein [Gammaproteobacteria bacterium]